MSLGRALFYFLREALIGLGRSWKVSVPATLAIGVSLFMGGLFLLVTDNVDRLVNDWRRQARVLVYFESGVRPAVGEQLQSEVTSRPWVLGAEPRSGEQAKERFRSIFPGLGGLLEGWNEEPLPASLEIRIDPEQTDNVAFTLWIEDLTERADVAMVDDDREWLQQLDKILLVLRGLGFVLAAVPLAAAILTIASVIRLTVYANREEIATLRLVGATEFFIRGPFYAEGLVQGLLGGSLAITGLYTLYSTVTAQASLGAIGMVTLEGFLPPRELALLVLLGGLAGLAGAVVSLRRETIGEVV